MPIRYLGKTGFFATKENPRHPIGIAGIIWLRGLDLNQRPSGYEPDELPDCSTPRQSRIRDRTTDIGRGSPSNISRHHPGIANRSSTHAQIPGLRIGPAGPLRRPGGDLLSRALRRSTIGAEGFHGRVRDGIGWGTLAMTTRSSKRTHQGRLAAGAGGIAVRSSSKSCRVRRRIRRSRTGLAAAHGASQAYRAISTG